MLGMSAPRLQCLCRCYDYQLCRPGASVPRSSSRMTPRLKSIPRTGETELHLMGNLLERHGHRPFYATEKLDGFSMSFGWVDGQFVVSARDWMIEGGRQSVFADAASELELRERHTTRDVLFQGELIGPRIRRNRYGLDRLQLHIFNGIRGGEFVSFGALKRFCRVIDLPTVPLLAECFEPVRENLLAFAWGQSLLNSSVEREGAVFRPLIETMDKHQGRVSFKVFNP